MLPKDDRGRNGPFPPEVHVMSHTLTLPPPLQPQVTLHSTAILLHRHHFARRDWYKPTQQQYGARSGDLCGLSRKEREDLTVCLSQAIHIHSIADAILQEILHQGVKSCAKPSQRLDTG